MAGDGGEEGQVHPRRGTRAARVERRRTCAPSGEPGLSQQWGLPAHFFCGFSPAAGDKTSGALSTKLSGSFCCGLASLPAADYFLDWRGATLSPVFSYRTDLWGQCRGPARLTLGARLLLTVAPDYREAIRQCRRPNHRTAPCPSGPRASAWRRRTVATLHTHHDRNQLCSPSLLPPWPARSMPPQSLRPTNSIAS
jgi:hypothetical protein